MGFGTALSLLNSLLFFKLKVTRCIKQMLPGNLALGTDSCCTGQRCSSEEVIQLTCGTRRQCRVPAIASCLTPITGDFCSVLR